MNVSQLCHRSVITCGERDHLDAAMSQMWRHNIGCLPVLGDLGQLRGMITDRDIAVAALLQGGPIHAITVSSVMSKEVLTCRDGDSVAEVLELLTRRRLRRLPVVDDARNVIGILSLNDIARAVVSHQLASDATDGLARAVGVPRSLAANAP
ncbi:MAG TPA: CBS domain-containing protein [Kofleriaceae bacterium]|nr:CBS domain-containing protein [Kofleriaceae bacterium]